MFGNEMSANSDRRRLNCQLLSQRDIFMKMSIKKDVKYVSIFSCDVPSRSFLCDSFPCGWKKRVLFTLHTQFCFEIRAEYEVSFRMRLKWKWILILKRVKKREAERFRLCEPIWYVKRALYFMPRVSFTVSTSCPSLHLHSCLDAMKISVT
jgi:hypothetical protein